MIVVDTNVISEMMREHPHPAVLEWIATVGRLHTTAITVAEIDYGIARLPEGRRKERVEAAAAGVFGDFPDVILSFDARAARRYGAIVAGRESTGEPVTMVDAQIAAVCSAWSATLATRNTGDFVGAGIDLVDPWGYVSE